MPMNKKLRSTYGRFRNGILQTHYLLFKIERVMDYKRIIDI